MFGQPQLLFIDNVLKHFVALMSGIASLIISTVTAIRKRPVVEKWFWFLGALCLFTAFDRAWQDEYNYAQRLDAEKSAASIQLRACQDEAQVSDAYARGAESAKSSLQSQLNSQQTAINSCVISLGKLNPVISREIKVVVYPVHADTTANFYDSLAFILTAHDEPKASGLLVCDQDFQLTAGATIVTPANGFVGTLANPNVVNSHEIYLNFASTASHWGPVTPIILQIRTFVARRIHCAFNPQ